MNTKNKQKVIDCLKNELKLYEDKWGNFKTEDNQVRFKVGATTLRCEVKVDTKPVSWH